MCAVVRTETIVVFCCSYAEWTVKKSVFLQVHGLQCETLLISEKNMKQFPLNICDFDCMDTNGRCAFMGTETTVNNILEMLTHKSSDAIANVITQCACA